MGLARLRAFLRRHARIGLDTSVFIYQLEDNSRYSALTDEIFAWLDGPGHSAVTSTIAMTELLVQPYRDSDRLRVNQFYALLSTYPNLDWIAPSLPIADVAASVRAKHRLRAPDALQAATALSASATGFVTNDAVFSRIQSLETQTLDQLLA